MAKPKNLFLDEAITAAASAYAAANPRHRNLSHLVQHLLRRELRANPDKLRTACRAAKLPVPEEIFSK